MDRSRYENQGYGGQGYGGQGHGGGQGPQGQTEYGWQPREQGWASRESGRTGRPWRRRTEAVAADVMTRDIKTCRPDESIRRCAEIMREESVGIVPVTDERQRLLGVITDRDIVVRVLAEDLDPRSIKVKDVMSTDIEAITPDTSIREALELMTEEHVRRLMVVERDDRLRGVVSMVDIAREANLDEELAEALAETSSRRSFWSQLW